MNMSWNVFVAVTGAQSRTYLSSRANFLAMVAATKKLRDVFILGHSRNLCHHKLQEKLRSVTIVIIGENQTVES